ncbi:hypothetical protein L6259_03045 [Candidatus Parcubacteria bacterium]|nr:hypothetical protein [Candidatus Parcubacteria bacterium]
MNRVIITRPEHDTSTRYLSRWSENIIKIAEQKGFEVFDLHKEKAIRQELEGRIKKTSPELVILNGHGDNESVGGHDNYILIKVGENEKILKNRITYAISCKSAKVLGKACADKKTAYIGYNEDFIFNGQSKYLQKPLKDKRAAQFLDAANQVTIALLKGHTAKEASDISKDAFKKALKKILPSTTSDPYAREDVRDLFWNMNHQVCLGNENAKI